MPVLSVSKDIKRMIDEIGQALINMQMHDWVDKGIPVRFYKSKYFSVDKTLSYILNDLGAYREVMEMYERHEELREKTKHLLKTKEEKEGGRE